jgi:hypothetical protein
MKNLIETFGPEKKRRSTSAAVTLKLFKENKVSNQSAEVSDKFKEGRHRIKLPRKKKPTEIRDNTFVTPDSSLSTMINDSWTADQDDLECFLTNMRTFGFEDENVFNDGMQNIFGRVSKITAPLICVTPAHIFQLQKFCRELLTDEDRSHVTVWIHRLQKYCVEKCEGIN